MAVIKLSAVLLDAIRVMRSGRGNIVHRCRPKNKFERMIFIPGPGLDIVNSRTFKAMKAHRLIRLVRRSHHQYEYVLTDLGKLLADDRVAFMRLMREVRYVSVNGHSVDPLTKCCTFCGAKLADLVAETDRKGIPPKCSPVDIKGVVGQTITELYKGMYQRQLEHARDVESREDPNGGPHPDYLKPFIQYDSLDAERVKNAPDGEPIVIEEPEADTPRIVDGGS